MYSLYPVISEYLDGTTASGLYEAKLGHDFFGKETHVYSPAYKQEDFRDLLQYADDFVFNSVSQVKKFADEARKAGKSTGLRINPEFSTQEGHAIYDPCSPGSRLGCTYSAFDPGIMPLIDGMHMHTLCEQDSDDLSATVEAAEKKFGEFFRQLKWINLGGGHHITRPGYNIALLEDTVNRLQQKYGVQVYLEPGEAVVLNAGYLVSSVIEKVHNGIDIAILDTSAACHMPDVLEMPYRPPVATSGNVGEKPYPYRLAGPTCLAGDVIGDYSFDKPLKEGDKIIFEDMALYTMVKTNTFNGMPLPDIAYRHSDGKIEIVRQFSYEDFKSRL